MAEMIIFSDCFDFRESNAYETLSAVWEYSAKTNNPNAKVILSKRPAPDTHGAKRSNISNTVKIKDWSKVMETNPDANIIFMDCDMIVLKDLSPLFEQEFDVAITKHSIGSLPYNGGFVAVKGTANAKKFMKLWVDINQKMFTTPSYHARYIKKYAGMNQAALGGLLEEHKDAYYTKGKASNENAALLLELPCAIWNLCRGYWPDVNKDSAVIHVKSELRQACLYDKPSPETEKCYRLYKQYKLLAKVPDVPIVNYTKKITRQRSDVGKKIVANLFRYSSYQDYKNCQIEATKLKAPLKSSWSMEENIKHISGVLQQLVGAVKTGICHGSRNGDEQAWFNKYIRGAKVYGTEICPDLKDIPNTITWDFNKENKDWIGKMDFVFTNCFDHVYDPQETLTTWIKQLKPKGRLIIEYTIQHENTKPTKVDPFKFSRGDLINLTKEWTNGEYIVYQFIQCPQQKTIQKKPHNVEYAVIEKAGLR